MMNHLKSMTQPEIAAVLKELGQPGFRAKQIYSWLHKGVTSYNQMTNIPQSLREILAEKYNADPLTNFSFSVSALWTLMDMIEKVKGIVAAQLRLEPESIADDASLIEDLGADSLDLVDIVMAFESEFDTTVPEEDFSELRTIKDLADYISARI